MKDLEELIIETQSVLMPLFTKPKCTSKLLAKPPFRFIHDIVIATLQATGFPKNYFSQNELDSSLVADKPSKIAFLDKLIELIGQYHDDVLNVKSSKIVAGLEPEYTNILLTRLGHVALNNDVDHVSIIQSCLNKKSTTSSRETQLLDDSNVIQKNSQRCSDNLMKESIARCNSDLKQTQKMLTEIISRPQCTEKLLSRPPFRFLYDLIRAIDEVNTFGLSSIMSPREYEQSYFNEKSAKISFLNKVIALIEKILGVPIDVSPSKIVAGVEVEKTCLFLQLIVIASSFQTRNNISKCTQVEGSISELVDLGDEKTNEVISNDNGTEKLASTNEDVSYVLLSAPFESRDDAQIVEDGKNEEIREGFDAHEVISPLDEWKDSDCHRENASADTINNSRIDPSLVDPWIMMDESPTEKVPNVGQSIDIAANSVAKMGAMILHIRSVWSQMQKEKDGWRSETNRIKQELRALRDRAQLGTDPVRLRVKELDEQIGKTKRCIELIVDGV